MVPGSAWLRRVSAHRVPRNATLFSAAAGVVAIGATYLEVGAVNLNALVVSYAVVGIYLSFQAVVLARILACFRGFRPDPASPFGLGRWGLPVAVAALVYGAGMIVNLAWPRPADSVTGWLTPGAALAIVVPGLLLAARRSPASGVDSPV
jgi:hypothetical protein